MKINIYYGGRGLVEDSTRYVIDKIAEVLEELRVEVKIYNLYEEKNGISALPSTLKGVDGIVLAANVEWYGIGGYLQLLLDSIWLYGDKEIIKKIYMMPVVVSSTFGEREAENTLIKSWELLGGMLCPGITAYVQNQTEFETSADYRKLIESRAEDIYRTIKQRPMVFPTSNALLLQSKMEQKSIRLTPEESERLSKYVSDNSFVKKQKEDIEELSEIFKDLMKDGESGQEFIKNLKENFVPSNDVKKVVFEIVMTDTNKTLVVEAMGSTMKAYYGECENPSLIATTTREVMNRIVNGRTTFQGAFMGEGLKVKGDFKQVRLFDQYFRFTKL